jgi:hypothetical protein
MAHGENSGRAVRMNGRLAPASRADNERITPEGKVKSMSKEKAEKAQKPKAAKPQQQAHPGDSKPKKEKAAKPAADAAAAAAKEAPKEEKPKAPPRPPADLRLKVLKKFHGKFLPRGPLRDRHKALMTRWNSGEDHGGVTLEELKSLHQDWLTARTKPPRKAGATV